VFYTLVLFEEELPMFYLVQTWKIDGADSKGELEPWEYKVQGIEVLHGCTIVFTSQMTKL
jgi:hypothetical protein